MMGDLARDSVPEESAEHSAAWSSVAILELCLEGCEPLLTYFGVALGSQFDFLSLAHFLPLADVGLQHHGDPSSSHRTSSTGAS